MIASEIPASYLVLDKISSKQRSILSCLLVITGYGLQLSLRNFFVGLPFIIACLIVNLIRGIAIKMERASEFKWEEVTLQRIEQVYAHCQKIKGFRSAGIGCLIGLIIGSLFFFFWLLPIFTSKSKGLPFSITIALVDSIILFGGLFASGNKSAWMPGNLDIKTGVIRQLTTHSLFLKDPSLKVAPYLELGQSKKGSFPNDARFLIKFTDAPDSFIGVQGQISINTVKSSAYPYFYMVIIAKPDFGLFARFTDPKLVNITIEQKKTNEVDVIVVRQTTTKTSGYHTDRSTQNYILENSVSVAKKILGQTAT